jgi:hypothetical protein
MTPINGEIDAPALLKLNKRKNKHFVHEINELRIRHLAATHRKDFVVDSDITRN